MRPKHVPAETYDCFDGAVEVRCYGKDSGRLNEKGIRQLIAGEQLPNHIVLRPATHTFNGYICEPNDLAVTKCKNGVTIASGCRADGVIIPPGQTAWLQTADCPTIIARHVATKEVIAAHAGRWSLIHEPLVRGRQPQRNYESVVDMICQRLLWDDGPPIDLEVFSCCGVGPIHFRHSTNHPLYGRDNKTLNRYIAMRYGQDCFLGGDFEIGALNLHQLIRNQFCRRGVPADNIKRDYIDTARQNDEWFSRRGGDRIGHNTVLVTRRA